jgi:hypothetical protein
MRSHRQTALPPHDVRKAADEACMTSDHEYRDFRCPDCGALVTCLSCVELHAASCFHGPAFVIANHSQIPAVASSPLDTSASMPPPTTLHQQSLFT